MFQKPAIVLPDIARIVALILFVCWFIPTQAQNTVVAGPQYHRSTLHKWLWGKNYRKEWTTAVNVPSFYLDTAAGGLKPYEAGGGRQSRTIKLHGLNGREYVIRSIDKSFGRAIPPIYQHTFIETIINDQVPISHPYSSVSIPIMADAARIYHTYPRIVYIPQQPALDSFNSEYGNRLYLVEQRPDENWEDAPNFGNSRNIVGTEKMLENIFEDNDHRADQLFYIRARLFDMLIGDASRHEDQWRWATFKEGGKTIYKAIPRDRDQAYGQFEGLLIKAVVGVADLGHLQTFNKKIHDVRLNNFPARNLDRQIANEPTLDQWISTAKQLQDAITDDVIERSVKQLPPELFPISGPAIIEKLKSRRDDLQFYASVYYSFLAREVEIVGTKGNEFFHITRLEDGNTSVSVSKINKGGETAATPFYSRTFHPKETKEIRIYGLAGNDVYRVDGESDKSIRTTIIGGIGADSIVDVSKVKGGKKYTVIYDDFQNTIVSSGETRTHLSNDTSVHHFNYNAFKYNEEGIAPSLFYSFEDRLYVGIGYKILRQGWRKDPFKAKHEVQANYSIMQKDFSFIYKGELRQVIGQWSLNLDGNYDLMRWTNFFGLGNNTTGSVTTRNYYQMESKDLLASVILNRPIGKNVMVGIGPVYSAVEIIENPERFLYQAMGSTPKIFDRKQFAGGRALLKVVLLNDLVVPTKGISFAASAMHLQNLETPGRNSTRLTADLNVFLPLLRKLVLVIRPAAAAVTGKPEFYQHISIGGSRNLRGYARDRFWGTSSFYSANELQYLTNVRTRLFNGKAGLIGFYDVGRVWLKNEVSDKVHTGYGGGILLAPFNMVLISVTYGMSTEGSQIHFRVGMNL